MVDFIRTASQVTGTRLREGDLDAMDPVTRNEFWCKIVAFVDTGEQFFEKMHPTRDARLLWHYVTRHPHYILTAAGQRIPNAALEKRQWVKKHLGQGVRVEIVKSSIEKAQYATPYTILIDDRSRCVDPFIAAGGMGILHKDAKTTIRQLQAFGL